MLGHKQKTGNKKVLDKSKEDKFILDGKVLDILPEGKFKICINLGDGDAELICYESGKMRLNYIRLNIGDKVKVEISKYDITKGRIIYRY